MFKKSASGSENCKAFFSAVRETVSWQNNIEVFQYFNKKNWVKRPQLEDKPVLGVFEHSNVEATDILIRRWFLMIDVKWPNKANMLLAFLMFLP